MDKFEAVYRRKSVRKYSNQKLSSSVLNEIKAKIKDIDRLFEDIDSQIVLAEDGQKVQETFSGLKSKIARVDAPHYLIGVSEEKEGYLENIGYMVEEAVLYLTKNDIASCWLGSGIEHDLLKGIFKFEGKTVILVAFGEPKKTALRDDPGSASRKAIEKLMIDGHDDLSQNMKKIIDCARMAPSAVNSQPWRFLYEDGALHVFIVKKGMFKKLARKISDLDRLNHIDAGIALKHLEIGAKKFSKGIRFEDLGKEKKGYEYIISASLS